MKFTLTNAGLVVMGIALIVSSLFNHGHGLLAAACVGGVLIVKGARKQPQPMMLGVLGVVAGFLTLIVNRDFVGGTSAKVLAGIVIVILGVFIFSRLLLATSAGTQE